MFQQEGGLLNTDRDSVSRRRVTNLASLVVLMLSPTIGTAEVSGALRATRPIPRPYVVYGTDGRYEVCEELDAARAEAARSVVAFIEKKNLRRTKDGDYSIQSEPYSKEYNLCPTERFIEQEVASICTGFLVAPDLVATAGHCVLDQHSCEGTKFVFDFKLSESGELPRIAKAGDVYGCKQLIASSSREGGKDFALLRLDRAVVGRSALPLRRSGTVFEGQEVFVVGHPAGLPAKFASGAQVRRNEGAYFFTNLDVYEGNSGSPVFNAQTLEVEGILVAGEDDFVKNGKCRVTKRCADNDCRGEEVTAISAIFPYLYPSKHPSLFQLADGP